MDRSDSTALVKKCNGYTLKAIVWVKNFHLTAGTVESLTCAILKKKTFSKTFQISYVSRFKRTGNEIYSDLKLRMIREPRRKNIWVHGTISQFY